MPRAANYSLDKAVRQSPPIDYSQAVDDAWIKGKTVVIVRSPGLLILDPGLTEMNIKDGRSKWVWSRLPEEVGCSRGYCRHWRHQRQEGRPISP